MLSQASTLVQLQDQAKVDGRFFTTAGTEKTEDAQRVDSHSHLCAHSVFFVPAVVNAESAPHSISD